MNVKEQIWHDSTKDYPKLGDKIEFETQSGLLVNGEYVNRHSAGAYWAKNWGYFYDSDIVRWRYIY